MVGLSKYMHFEKEKKKSMYQVTAIHIMEEFYIWPLSLIKDSMAALI